MKDEGTRQFTRLLRSEVEYDAAVEEIDRLLDAHHREGSAADERIEFLSLLVEEYDRKHYSLPGPDPSPQDIVEFMLEAHELDKTDLAEPMGGRSRVSEFFSGKRDLSISQVQALRDLLHVPADLLLPATSSISPAPKVPASPRAPRVVSRVRESIPDHKAYGGNIGIRRYDEPAIKRAAVHVVPSPAKRGKFVVRVRGKVLTHAADKNAAIARATEIARNNKTTLAIHSSSGRIITRQVGKDPNPPRGRRR